MDRSDLIRITEVAPNTAGILERYASVSIAFDVTSKLALHPVQRGLGGLLLVEETVAVPFVKDYDAVEGAAPLSWEDRFPMSRCAIFMAADGPVWVGGAMLARNRPRIDGCGDRDDVAVLWDLRVHPDYRRCGIGRRLFEAAEEWASKRGCAALAAETQNINVPACRFYAGRGCELRSIRQDAYPGLPEEVQLLWYKML
jgi:GNAT superfamily N-acetyltransferase